VHAEQGQRVLGLERPLAGDHLEQHDPDGVDVGALVDDAAADRLLGRHVVRRPDDDVGLRRVAAGGAAQPREAEVEDPHVLAGADLLGDHDVRRLDVAVGDPLRVRVREARDDLAGERERAHGQQRALVHDLPQGAAGDELHHQVRRALPDPEVDDRDAVRVGELAHHPGLALEPREELRVVGVRRVEELDRDELADGDALGLVDDAHRARVHRLEDLVALVDEAAEPTIHRRGHGHRRA
jgi:hypothetical protein